MFGDREARVARFRRRLSGHQRHDHEDQEREEEAAVSDSRPQALHLGGHGRLPGSHRLRGGEGGAGPAASAGLSAEGAATPAPPATGEGAVEAAGHTVYSYVLNGESVLGWCSKISLAD